MRAREFAVKEQTPTTPETPSTSGTTGSTPPDDTVGKLTATISDLQKQVQDLQKNALLQAPSAAPQPQTTPPAVQPQTAQGTTKTQAPSINKPATPSTSQTPSINKPAASQVPSINKPAAPTPPLQGGQSANPARQQQIRQSIQTNLLKGHGVSK